MLVDADAQGHERDDRCKLRDELRRRTALRLDVMYDSRTHRPTKKPVASWGHYLHASAALVASGGQPVPPRKPKPLRADAVPVTLLRDTVRFGVHEQIERQFRYAEKAAKAKARGKKPPQGAHSTVDRIIEGTIAELAVAARLCLFWSPSVGVQKPADDPDVGGVVEVKHRANDADDLLVKAWQVGGGVPDWRPFVLAVGAAPYFAVVGWLPALEIKQHPLRSPKCDPYYRVPQLDLHPITRAFAQCAHERSPAVKRLKPGGKPCGES